MAERVTANTLIIIFTGIIVIFSIIYLITMVQANQMFWILRPSDSTAMDIVSRVNAMSGTTGRVSADYRNITSSEQYYITNEDKIVCVIAKLEEPGSQVLKTVNCYSTSKSVSIPDLSGKKEFLLCLQKDYDPNTGKLNIDTWWCPVNGKCGDGVCV